MSRKKLRSLSRMQHFNLNNKKLCTTSTTHEHKCDECSHKFMIKCAAAAVAVVWDWWHHFCYANEEEKNRFSQKPYNGYALSLDYRHIGESIGKSHAFNRTEYCEQRALTATHLFNFISFCSANCCRRRRRPRHRCRLLWNGVWCVAPSSFSHFDRKRSSITRCCVCGIRTTATKMN